MLSYYFPLSIITTYRTPNLVRIRLCMKFLDILLDYTGCHFYHCLFCKVVNSNYDKLSLASCFSERVGEVNASLTKRLWACEGLEVGSWGMLNRGMFLALDAPLYHLLHICFHGWSVIIELKSSDIKGLASDMVAAYFRV